jgi:beta-lactamase regulating signal transducer with metallopeptidase domain
MRELCTFLIEWSLKLAATVVLGCLCSFVVRRRSAATKHLVWRIAVVVGILLPVAMAVSPALKTPSLMEPVQAPIRSAFVVRPQALPAGFKPRTERGAAAIANLSDDAPWLPIALGVYLLGVLLTLGTWAASLSKIRQIAKEAMRGSDLVLVATEPALRVPITYGALRPVILLPADSESWPAERVESAVRHETAHIKRQDWLWQTLAVWVRAIHWFNPLAWVLTAALTKTAESAADDEVVASGLTPSIYASELLRVAEGARTDYAAATPMARTSEVAERLRRIVSEEVDRRRPARPLVAGVVLLFGVATVLIAAGSRAQALPPSRRVQRETPYQFGPVESEARLSHGLALRLVYLTGPDISHGQAWRPDGRPATQEDRHLFKDMDADLVRSEALKGGRVVVAYFAVTGLRNGPDSEIGTRFYRKNRAEDGPAADFLGLNNLSRALYRVPFRVLPDERGSDFQVGIADGPFKTIGKGTIGDGKYMATVGERIAGESAVADPEHPNKPKFVYRYDPSASTVRLYAPTWLEGKDLRMRAYDAAGDLLQTGYGPEEPDADSVDGNHLWEFTYGQNPPKDIVRFELQVRDYEWVTLKGIHLQPDETP